MEIIIVYIIEDRLSVKGTVIVTHTRMVSAYDQMTATVILTKDCMQDGLSRSSVPHFHRIDLENNSFYWIIILKQHLIAFHPYVCWNIIGFELTDVISAQYALLVRIRYYVDLLTQLWFAPAEIPGYQEIRQGFMRAILEAMNQAINHHPEVMRQITESL